MLDATWTSHAPSPTRMTRSYPACRACSERFHASRNISTRSRESSDEERRSSPGIPTTPSFISAERFQPPVPIATSHPDPRRAASAFFAPGISRKRSGDRCNSSSRIEKNLWEKPAISELVGGTPFFPCHNQAKIPGSVMCGADCQFASVTSLPIVSAAALMKHSISTSQVSHRVPSTSNITRSHVIGPRLRVIGKSPGPLLNSRNPQASTQ